MPSLSSQKAGTNLFGSAATTTRDKLPFQSQRRLLMSAKGPGEKLEHDTSTDAPERKCKYRACSCNHWEERSGKVGVD